MESLLLFCARYRTQSFVCLFRSDQLKHLNAVVISIANEYACPIRIQCDVVDHIQCARSSSGKACRTPSNCDTLTVAQIPTLDAVIVLIGYVDCIASLQQSDTHWPIQLTRMQSKETLVENDIKYLLSSDALPIATSHNCSIGGIELETKHSMIIEIGYVHESFCFI